MSRVVNFGYPGLRYSGMFCIIDVFGSVSLEASTPLRALEVENTQTPHKTPSPGSSAGDPFGINGENVTS